MGMHIDDYLTEKQKQEIAADVFKDSLEFVKEKELERFLTNAAYNIVWKMVDEVMDNKVEEILRDKVIKIINELTVFSIFKAPTNWDRESNANYELLRKIVKENRYLLEDKVKRTIVESDFQYEIAKDIGEAILSKLSK